MLQSSRLALGFGCLLFAIGCGPRPLEQTRPTPDALARAVLAALARHDETHLRALAISEAEFEHSIWPGLPAARPERNMPWSYVWMDLRQKSDARLRHTLQEHGGKRYELEAVRFEGQSTKHGTYRVHRGTVLQVRRPAGQPLELRVIGSLIEAENGWKVLSFLVDQ